MPSKPRPIRGAALLEQLEHQGQLFCQPADTAAVTGKDPRTIYAAIKSGEIPSTKIGQRYHISVAWLRRQVDGTDVPAAGQAGIAGAKPPATAAPVLG